MIKVWHHNWILLYNQFKIQDYEAIFTPIRFAFDTDIL